MAYDTTRYRKMYGKLIALYPRAFRERVGESMEQTFNDLLCERRDAGENIFRFAFWTFSNTLVGIIKANIQYMNLKTKVNGTATVILLGALVFLGVAWWINGRDDTWIYASNALIVAMSFFFIYTNTGNKKDQ
jgi:hypothetical protein